MNKYLFLTVSIICLFAGIILSYIFRSKPKTIYVQPINNGIRQIDSANKERLRVEQKAKIDSTSLSKQIDSLKTEYLKSKKDLQEERKRNLQLSHDVDYAYGIMDTSAFFKYCNELSAEVKIQDNKIQDLQDNADSLQRKNDSLNNLMSVRLKEWQSFSSYLKCNAGAQANIIDSLNKVLIKKDKKLDKKYNISLGAFGGLTNFGFGGGVGIVVGKTVFKF